MSAYPTNIKNKIYFVVATLVVAIYICLQSKHHNYELCILVALVVEVYLAQKERDEAIMSRLQLANEERDEAIARAKHMEMSLKLYVCL